MAWPYVEEERVVLVPLSMDRAQRYIYGLNVPDYHDRTWVAFDFTGEVSVNISKKDYATYRDDFAFDQLCGNLGQVFIDFFNHFKRGEEDRIFERLDAMKVSLFS